jgi:O-antigen ligase
MFTNSSSAFENKTLKWFAVGWAISLIAPLVYFPVPFALVGHPWKVELVISFVLFVSLIGVLLFQREKNHVFSIAPQIVRFIIAPCCAFIIWSALSVFWAGSLLSVVHHTLVWACYLTFFLFAVRVASDKRLFKITIIALGSVISVVSLCCIFEFIFEESIGETFGTRYARYAEIFAALLPLFFSFVLRLKRKHLLWTVFAAAFLWLGLLFSMSRGALFSSIAGLSVFIFLRIFCRKSAAEKRRLMFAVAGLVFIALLAQVTLSIYGNQKGGTFSRVAIHDEKDPGNSFSRNVRFLFAGVGREMFFDNRLIGVGADNFGLEFNKYRAVFSENPENKLAARQSEEYLPERAHNEYLQISAELGIVGAAIFLWLLFGIAKLGFAEVVKNRFEPSSILTHAAIGGIVAFLISSCFSSFSFRLMQNGLVFFFLLALLLRNFAFEKNSEKQNNLLVVSPRLKLAFVSIALIACVSLTVFSALKATSQYLIYQAEREADFETAQTFYRNAIALDAANASADFSFGIRLFGAGKYVQSAEEFRQSVNKGLNDSVSYSYLISAQTLAKQPQKALNTASEAVRIFPYSVFLRVRFAALLNKFDEKDEAENQLNIAAQIDKKQAETWHRLINEGSLKATQAASVDKQISTLDKLVPAQAVYAVLAEREILHPEEKSKFNF